MHTALDVRALSSRYAVRPLLRPDARPFSPCARATHSFTAIIRRL